MTRLILVLLLLLLVYSSDYSQLKLRRPGAQ
jgi:hypothetical protein